jgi:hypothetical protein
MIDELALGAQTLSAMNARQKKHNGMTPSFPALRDELIPQMIKGEAPIATSFTDEFPGIDGLAIAAGKKGAPSRVADDVYARYMHSPRWQQNRQPALDRAAGRCERCGVVCCALEVHHITYERSTNELPDDLLALCLSCHRAADRERRAAWREQLEKWRDEAEERRKDWIYFRVDSYMRRVYGDGWEEIADPDHRDEIWERFERDAE